ncbi:MAG: DUF4390 domain-containing protein [Deltaproteobacteria bacterium]|nr:MAG: DUF4390 domain-containing protein [Deltaproteobacteria bacterium]
MCILRRPLGPVALFLLLSLLILSPSAVHSAEATLSEIIVTNTQDDLLVFFEIQGSFTREMEEAILNGIPTTFNVIIDLYRSRMLWLDASIASLKIEHTIKYDSLKNEFRVWRSEDNHNELVFKDFAEAKKAMTEIKQVKVVPLSELRKSSKYQLRVKAELEKVRLPLYLHYVLFFVSLWDFETDWYTVDFTY